MAIVVMILGESGTGKSASLRNFKPEDMALINVMGKPLPFRARGFETMNTDDYGEIQRFLAKTEKPSIVIDDAQYLMANEFMRRAREKGYEKFTEIGQNFWNLINFCRKMDDNKIIYFLQHTETSADGSTVKAKTIGKMLDEKVSLEGMFAIVLRTSVEDGVYTFRTQNSGQDTVKSPVGMFDDIQIPNDLKLVDTKIREYYDITGLTVDSAPVVGQLTVEAESKDGIVDDDSPLIGDIGPYSKLLRVMNEKGVTDAEMRGIVADKGIYPLTMTIDKYDPDFIDYLVDNFGKIYGAIVAKRDPLGE